MSNKPSFIDKFVFNDKETAAMSIATAIGGSQILLLNTIFRPPQGDRGNDNEDIYLKPSEEIPTSMKIVGIIGGIAFGTSLLGLFGKVPMNRVAAATLFGYGMSSVISTGIPIALSLMSQLPEPPEVVPASQ